MAAVHPWDGGSSKTRSSSESEEEQHEEVVAPIERLPHEVVVMEVFKYLDEEDMRNVAQVNQWFHYMASDCLLWRRLYMKNFPSSEYSALLDDASSWKDAYRNSVSQIPARSLPPTIVHEDEVWGLAFSPGGDYVASASRDTFVKVWDVSSGPHPACVFTLGSLRAPASDVQWSPDGRYILTVAADRSLVVWDAESGKQIKKLASGASAAAFTPGGLVVAATTKAGKRSGSSSSSSASSSSRRSTGTKHTVSIMTPKGQSVYRRRVDCRVTHISVSPDNSFAVCALLSGVLLVLDLADHSCQILEENGIVGSTAVSANSRYVLTNLRPTNDSDLHLLRAEGLAAEPLDIERPELHLWDMETHTILRVYKGLVNKTFWLQSCFGGPGDCFVVSGSEDGSIFVWHRDSGALIEALHGHDSVVNSVVWSPQLETFASCSDDCTVRLWHLHEQVLPGTAAAKKNKMCTIC